MKSSDNILTDRQKDIFNDIFNLFGKEIKDTFITMLTFYEGGKPAVHASLQDESFIFHKIVKTKKDSYFKFNNSSIFEKDINNFLNFTSWNISIGSFKRFTEKLDTLPSIKLDQTKTVINELDKLGRNFEIAIEQLKYISVTMLSINGCLKMISDLKEEMNQSKNFKQK